MAEVEGLLEKDFSEKFTSLKNGRNDFVINAFESENDSSKSLVVDSETPIEDLVETKIEKLKEIATDLKRRIQLKNTEWKNTLVIPNYMADPATSDDIKPILNDTSDSVVFDYDKMLILAGKKSLKSIPGPLHAMKRISVNPEVQRNKKEKLALARNENDNMIALANNFKDPIGTRLPESDNNSLKTEPIIKDTNFIKKTNNIDSWQRPITEPSAIKTDTTKPTLSNTNKEINTESDKSDTYDSKVANSQIHDDPNNDKMLILTKSDEDRVKFRTIVESMLSKTSLDNRFKCLKCDKEFNSNNAKQYAMSHVDHKHTDHILHKCHICDKIVKSNDGLTRHIQKCHKNSRILKKEVKKTILNSTTGSLQTTKRILINPEGKEMKKVKLTSHPNGNDNITELKVPLTDQANGPRLSEYNNNSWQIPSDFKLSIPILNTEIPQMIKELNNIADIETDLTKQAFHNVKNERNTEADLNGTYDSKVVHTDIIDDPDDDKKLILTKSDEDKAQFHIIMESMIRKNSWDKGYRCLECDREFNGAQAKRHAICHVDLKHTSHVLHKCHICDLIVKTKDSLIRHIGKIHQSTLERLSVYKQRHKSKSVG